MLNFELNQEKVNEILSDFSIEKASKTQRENIAEIVTILEEYTGITTKTMVGFVYISILSWENENNEPFKTIESYSTEDREAAVEKICNGLKFILRGVLVKPEQGEKLEEAIDIAYTHYRNKWKQRLAS